MVSVFWFGFVLSMHGFYNYDSELVEMIYNTILSLLQILLQKQQKNFCAALLLSMVYIALTDFSTLNYFPVP